MHPKHHLGSTLVKHVCYLSPIA